MMSFKTWLEQYEAPVFNKPWKASKPEILQHWQALAPSLPIAQMRVVPANHKGTTMSFDGIRVSGGPSFIDYVLSRLKDLAAYENPKTRLNLIYKQQVDNKTQQPIPNSYVLYAGVKQRGSGEKDINVRV